MYEELKTITNNPESSTVDLTTNQKNMLKNLEAKYQPIINIKGVNQTFNDVYQAIIARYNASPALFTPDTRMPSKTIQLPIHKKRFDEIATTHRLTKPQITKALHAYYQHPTHSIFRYLSKPNPWMAENAEHVHSQVIDGLTERWSTFNNHKHLITLLWLAACDMSEPTINGFTLDTRIDELVNEIALIGRAHNWDKTRYKKDKNGQPKLDNSGSQISEYYDDLEGDKPSCFRGLGQRLCQALKGHPLCLPDINDIIEQELHQRVRDHMITNFQKTDTSILEAVLIDYAKLTHGEDPGALIDNTHTWNITKHEIRLWQTQIQIQNRETYNNNEILIGFNTGVKKFFSAGKSLPHFLAHVQHCQLNTLCQNELDGRRDSLANKIEQHYPEMLATFLRVSDEVTGQSRLLNAIYLGLLGKVGQKMGIEAFTQLLCPDEATKEFYAGVLVPYIKDARLKAWLSTLNKTDSASFLSIIRNMARQDTPFTPVENFMIFLNGMDENLPGIRQLHSKIINFAKLQSVEKSLDNILNQWEIQFPTKEIADAIRQKAKTLKLLTTATAEASSLVSNTDPRPSRAEQARYTSTFFPSALATDAQNTSGSHIAKIQ